MNKHMNRIALEFSYLNIYEVIVIFFRFTYLSTNRYVICNKISIK